MAKYSIIYPTRHKPKFIEMALFFLSKQTFTDFEVIISDNFIDATRSCESICKKALSMYDMQLLYVTPKRDLNMVENWNFAYRYASGEYIIFLSDKMLLLPLTLERITKCIKDNPEIINWPKAPYYPNSFPDYFGAGEFLSIKSTESYFFYDTKQELIKKYKNPKVFSGDYYRGQLYMGAYKRTLCEKIIHNTGALFHPLSPDVTSMLFGLFFAEKAVEFSSPGVVVIANDLSNGNACINSADLLISYVESFRQVNSVDSFSNQALVVGLKHSSYNYITRDYQYCKKFTMCNLNESNWLACIYNEIIYSKKKYRDELGKDDDKYILEKYLKKRGRGVRNKIFHVKCFFLRNKSLIRNKLVWIARRYLSFLWRESIVKCKDIKEVLLCEELK